ncbi:hypothetical protein GGR53DRAFT_510534 [Hypoxylon sp. FL1150]|nr:hypothetical protein GGR53DRAFT_510534 [Hypoxylon sp. FL1150]
MAIMNQDALLKLPDPVSVFSARSCLGFFTQCVVMLMNGSFANMLLATCKSVFPDDWDSGRSTFVFALRTY